MIPRGTRARPILEIRLQQGVAVYTNNIYSPGVVHPSCFILQQPAFRADAVTCSFTKPNKILRNYGGCSFDIILVSVAFWSKDISLKGPLLLIEIYMPLDWSLERFLVEVEDSVSDCKIISLFNSYTIKGIMLPFNTINSIHEKYKQLKNK
jgi:hypothetical protein